MHIDDFSTVRDLIADREQLRKQREQCDENVGVRLQLVYPGGASEMVYLCKASDMAGDAFAQQILDQVRGRLALRIALLEQTLEQRGVDFTPAPKIPLKKEAEG